MDFWQIIKLPWSMLQVLSSRKSFADNPVLGSSWLNERGLHRTRCAGAVWQIVSTRLIAGPSTRRACW